MTFGGAAMGTINFRNNIVSTQSTAQQALLVNANVPRQALKMAGNLYYAPQIAANRVLNMAGAAYSVTSAIQAGLEASSVYGDPLFVNQANFNFAIAMNSPAKSGAPLTLLNVVSVTTDYAGAPRAIRPSIGAYDLVRAAKYRPSFMNLDSILNTDVGVSANVSSKRRVRLAYFSKVSPVPSHVWRKEP
jgi:hypothetical protein